MHASINDVMLYLREERMGLSKSALCQGKQHAAHCRKGLKQDRDLLPINNNKQR